MDDTFNGVTSRYRDEGAVPFEFDDDLSSEASDPEEHLSGVSMETDLDTSLDSRHSNGLRSRSLRLRNKIHRTPTQDKVRHKRQTLQDMARPLKQWLYQHRDNPYPTKSEKVSLALGSQMTLTQVSNWFANARRRLKNTVRDPSLTWGKRIKMYNNHVQGNAELLSISSEDSTWDSEEDSQGEPGIGDYSSETTCTERTFRPKDDIKSDVRSMPKDNTMFRQRETTSNPAPPAASPRTLQGNITHAQETVLPKQSNNQQECSNDEKDQEQMPKYKQTILQRYLHDAYEHSFQPVQPNTPYRTRYSSGSLSSHDFEEMSTSSRSSPTVDHHYTFEDQLDEVEQALRHRHVSNNSGVEDELYWKEISAAMALTNLARSRSSKLIIS